MIERVWRLAFLVSGRIILCREIYVVVFFFKYTTNLVKKYT